MSATSIEQDGIRRARDVARRHARSFYAASFALGGARRRGALVLYAFCRRVDDVVDEATSVDPRPTLARVRAIVSRLPGVPDPRDVPPPWHPAEIVALAAVVRRFDLPVERLHELIDGVAMDLAQRRYATFAELDVYCWRVAGTVGVLLARLLGADDPAAAGPAADLGRAMQLTNILRDVREDLDRDRIYLPADELAAAGIGEDDLRRGRVDERFRWLMRAQIARARQYYDRAARGVPYLRGPRARLAVRLMAAFYADILRAIEAQDYDVFRRRAAVSGRRKVALAAAVLRQAARTRERIDHHVQLELQP